MGPKLRYPTVLPRTPGYAQLFFESSLNRSNSSSTSNVLLVACNTNAGRGIRDRRVCEHVIHQPAQTACMNHKDLNPLRIQNEAHYATSHRACRHHPAAMGPARRESGDRVRVCESNCDDKHSNQQYELKPHKPRTLQHPEGMHHGCLMHPRR